jgi:hypothetical protein
MFNNRGSYTPENCEVDACNEHVGQGGGQPHLHGDPFGPTCLYSKANYTNVAGAFDATVHPPLVGFSLDGYPIYGRHLSANAVGYSAALDTCGGHAHDAYGYHYHMQVVAATTGANTGAPGNTAGQSYPATTVGVFNCWRGNVTADPYINAGNGGPAFSTCSGQTSYYKRADIALPGVAGSTPIPQPSASGTASGAGPTAAASAAAAALVALAVAALERRR